MGAGWQRAGAITALTFAVWWQARAGHAQGLDERSMAQRKVVEGRALRDRGDHAGALQKFLEAYAVSPSPTMHFDIAEANRSLGHDAEAVEAFERFLAEATDAAADLRSQAAGHVRVLRPRVATVEVDCDTLGADVSIDGRPYGRTPLLRSLVVAPGAHEILVQKPGRSKPYAARFEAARGGGVRVPARLKPGAQILPPVSVPPALAAAPGPGIPNPPPAALAARGPGPGDGSVAAPSGGVGAAPAGAGGVGAAPAGTFPASPLGAGTFDAPLPGTGNAPPSAAGGLAATTPAPAPAEPGGSILGRWWFWAGAVAVIGAATLGGMAASGAFRAGPNQHICECDFGPGIVSVSAR